MRYIALRLYPKMKYNLKVPKQCGPMKPAVFLELDAEVESFFHQVCMTIFRFTAPILFSDPSISHLPHH